MGRKLRSTCFTFWGLALVLIWVVAHLARIIFGQSQTAVKLKESNSFLLSKEPNDFKILSKKIANYSKYRSAVTKTSGDFVTCVLPFWHQLPWLHAHYMSAGQRDWLVLCLRYSTEIRSIVVLNNSYQRFEFYYETFVSWISIHS